MDKRPLFLRTFITIFVIALFIIGMYPLRERDYYQVFMEMLKDPGDKDAAALVEELARMINGVPNEKRGVYRLGLHSITVRWPMGKNLAATPDGRLQGERTSLNTGASFGADREGTTAHIISVTTLDATHSPNSVTLDLDLHSSAVKGENGLQVMYATLKTYISRGGFSVHYNVLDSETLRAAQKKPEDYPNLQVRVCGWNYLFTKLVKEQQDDYILRAERDIGA